MLSQEAKSFMEFCISAYKESGKNEFYISDYMHIPNYEAAISELIEKGLLENKVPSALSTPLPLTHEGFWGFPLSLFVVKYSYV